MRLSSLEVGAVTFAGIAALAGTVQTALVFWALPQPFRVGIHERQVDLCLDFIENSEQFRFLAYETLVIPDSKTSSSSLGDTSELVDEMAKFSNRFVALSGVEVTSGGIGSLRPPTLKHDGYPEQLAIADFYDLTASLWIAINDMDADELNELGASSLLDDAEGSINKLAALCGDLVSAKSSWVS